MSLIGKWFLTEEEDFDVAHSEHVDLAIAAMLLYPKKFAPHLWNVNGVPKEELEAALERGADPEAIEFLSKGKDARLWAVREFGWIRTTKNAWDVWVFDDSAAEIAQKAKAYWRSQYSMNQWDMIDVHELKDGCRYQINAKKLLDGGRPKVLKRLAMGNIECGDDEHTEVPQYSTAKFSELERRALYKKSGDNPKRRSRR